MNDAAGSSERYSRQAILGAVGPEGEARIRRARVLILGCGALGTHAAEHLVRAGAGEVHLVDRDVVEWSNLSRQIGYTEGDAARAEPKAVAAARHLGEVNSQVEVVAHPVELRHENALELARGMDLLLDGSDNTLARYLLNDTSYRLGIPWIYAGAIETRGQVQAFSGRKGPCLRCTHPEPPPPGTLATCDTAGVLGPAAGVVACWQAVLALRILVTGSAEGIAGQRTILEPWDLRARTVPVATDPSCPACARGRFDFLAGNAREDATTLCGREAVMVRPPPGGAAGLDLATLAGRLRPAGTVDLTPYCLRFEAPGVRVTIFADGRAIFYGLSRPEEARSLYARYIGT